MIMLDGIWCSAMTALSTSAFLSTNGIRRPGSTVRRVVSLRAARQCLEYNV